MRYVVDTSVLAKVFINESHRDRVVALLNPAMAKRIELHAPSLVLYEINNVLVSKRATGRHYDDAMRFLFAWTHLGVLVLHEPDEDLLRRAEAIASIDTQGQGYISSFDATFHALAIRIDAAFVTSDEAHVRKTARSVGFVASLQSLPV
jgi:predicted nucleic acid-binding protein